MAASPTFAGTPRTGIATISAANLNRDGTGTIVALFTPGSSRSVADGVTTSGSPVVTSATAAFTAADTGRLIAGAGIPSGSTALYVNSTTVLLLLPAATTGAVAPATGATATGTGVTLVIGQGGSRATALRITAVVTSGAQLVRLYRSIDSGSTWALWKEVSLSAVTIATGTAGASADVSLLDASGQAIGLASTDRLGAAPELAQSMRVITEYADL